MRLLDGVSTWEQNETIRRAYLHQNKMRLLDGRIYIRTKWDYWKGVSTWEQNETIRRAYLHQNKMRLLEGRIYMRTKWDY